MSDNGQWTKYYRERMRYRNDFLTVPEEEEKLTENYCVVYIKGGA